MTAGVLMLVLGLASLLGPSLVPNNMPLLSKLVLAGLGALLLVGGVIVIIVTSLYVKASPDKALVRTGKGGRKVVMDGGIIFIGALHRLTEVNLKLMKLKVSRTADKALFAGDFMRADIEAEFYVRVEPTAEGVAAAAATLGERTQDEERIIELIEEKLVNVLRSEAAKMNLIDLNKERDKFTSMVLQGLDADLKHNGLKLETVAISRLDMTPYDPEKPAANVFDAQGRMSAQQIISKARITENQARRDAELAVAEKDRETREAVANQEFLQAQANATRDANIAKAKAEQDKEAGVAIAGRKWETEQARIIADESIGKREAEKTQAVQVAQAQAEQAAQVADQAREQGVEVASRNKDIAIAEAEKSKSLAQAEQKKAEQENETQAQGVITVTKKAEAERTKIVQVIAAEQAAQVQKTEQFMEADIKAYELQTVATGQLKAAEQEADARKIKATAEQEALIAEAAGQTAVANVPINVKAREVEVDAQRVETVDKPTVEVLKSRLFAQNEYTAVSVELEKYRIMWEAIKEALVAQANAVGQALSSADMKLFGSPEMLSSFTSKFGMGVGLNALLESALGGNGQDLGGILGTATAKAVGALTPDQATKAGELIGRLKSMVETNPQIAEIVSQFAATLAS